MPLVKMTALAIVGCLAMAAHPAAAQSRQRAEPAPIWGAPVATFGAAYNTAARRINLATRAIEVDCGGQVQIICQYRAGGTGILVRAQVRERQVQEVTIAFGSDNREQTMQALMAIETVIAMAEPSADPQERTAVIRTLLLDPGTAPGTRRASLGATRFEVTIAPGVGMFLSASPR